jgi:hypothetical protein
MSKATQSVAKKAANIVEILEDEVSSREEKFDNRSEKWQESDKGSDFEAGTDDLREALAEAENLAQVIDEFNMAN